MKEIKVTNLKELTKQNELSIKQYLKEHGETSFNKQNTRAGMAHYNDLPVKPILFVDNLYKQYPKKPAPAINHISFNVYPGQFHAFIGANGAGKTTSIKSIIGAYAIWEGTVLINGHKNTSVEAKQALGYIPEAARFPDKMGCYAYLVWMAKLSGFKSRDAKNFARRRLEELNLWNLRKKSPNSFSSGQKKKILLAQALINNPDILVMDEPAANLDPKARIELFETLGKLQKEGKAIFISSHVLAEMDQYANAATILDGGKIVFSGTTKELYAKYADRKIMVNVDKPDILINYFKKESIPYEVDELSGNYVAKFASKEQEGKFLKAIQTLKLNLTTYSEVGNKLDDIYKKLIRFGSVDTMKK